jgi:hypothetical protein
LSFLRAVIMGEDALSSQATLKKYDLGTSANVVRIKKALVDREIIDVMDSTIQILDPVFKNWLVTRYFRS